MIPPSLYTTSSVLHHTFQFISQSISIPSFPYYIQMSYLICEKHNKVEKVGSKILTNGYICMNRYCPDSFKVFCSNCKNDHRDHSIKILTIEDTFFLVERLIKAPFKEVGRVIGEALDIMKKLKLIKEFRKKIDILEKEVQRQSLNLIQQTDVLIEDYSRSKESVVYLSQLFAKIQQADIFKVFSEKSTELLSNLDYNFKKDKFQFGSSQIKQKEDKRRKSVQKAKRKIEQVRDYSMKIIEVILHNDDSEQDEQDILYKKKHYQVLMQELSIDKNQKQLDEEISELKNSKATTNRSRSKRQLSYFEVQTQETILTMKQIDEKINSKIHELNKLYGQQENDYKLKIAVTSKEKQNLNRELSKFKEKYDEKKKRIGQIQGKLRQNKANRIQKCLIVQDIMNKIIQFSQLKTTFNQQKND